MVVTSTDEVSTQAEKPGDDDEEVTETEKTVSSASAGENLSEGTSEDLTTPATQLDDPQDTPLSIQVSGVETRGLGEKTNQDSDIHTGGDDSLSKITHSVWYFDKPLTSQGRQPTLVPSQA